MKEYIERAVALEILKRNPIGTWRGAPVYSEEIKSAADEIGDLPAAGVAEVRHGRWEFLGPNSLNRDCMCGTCSACHVRSVYIVNTAICPNCGALMLKDDNGKK